ncbi:MAG TPA: MCP four helix bundle domain-containing protein, partial [Burkholderiaceae bacterium]|nr:MCP four helix bundle domain-containing protein [Burkholderiaceae bacterium]
MKLLNQLKVGPRLALGFAVVLCLLILISIIGASSVNKLHGGLETVYLNRTVPTANLAEINVLMLENRVLAMKMLAATDPVQAQRWASDMGPHMNRIGELWRQYMANPMSEREKALAQQVAEARQVYVSQGLDAVRQAALDGRLADPQIVVHLTAQLDATAQDVLKRMSNLLAFQTSEAKSEYEAAGHIKRQAEAVDWIATILAVGLGALIAWAIAHSITDPLRSAVEVATKIRQGDLTHDVAVVGRDELAQVLTALQSMQSNLRSMTSEIRNRVDQVSTASSQIAAGNQDLSSRTEQQASSLQETAASMEQLTGTVRQSADNAQQANALAVSASDAATKGGQVVAQVVATMEDISSSSKKIADIIGVIDGIAFQTNILA